jgi:dienelactone hydrolase
MSDTGRIGPRCRIWVALASLVMTIAGAGPAAWAQPRPFTELFYTSDGLRIQAYLYRPEGRGPFPLIVYNHGSRAGHESESVPFTYIGELFAGAGYAVLVPERRGYGKSEGPPVPSERASLESALVARLQAETDDVLAAVEHMRSVDGIDVARLGIAGWSLGGIVTMFTASRTPAFKAAIDQAGGALVWSSNAAMRDALADAARKAQAPVFLMVAENDRTTDSITTLDRVLTDRGWPHQTRIYPPFHPSRGGIPNAPGHLIFGREGVPVWRGDAVAFFDRYLKPGG